MKALVALLPVLAASCGWMDDLGKGSRSNGGSTPSLSESATTVQCRHCSEQTPKDSKYCANCSKPMAGPSDVPCSKCSKLLPVAAKFCPECSHPVAAKKDPPAEKLCTQCGKPVGADAKFCPNCRAEIGGASPAGERCPRCNKGRQPGLKFCLECNYSFPE